MYFRSFDINKQGQELCSPFLAIVLPVYLAYSLIVIDIEPIVASVILTFGLFNSVDIL